MEHLKMHVIISSVSKQLFNGFASSLNVPGVDGDMTILPHHEALVSLLRSGSITIKLAESDEVQTYTISGGTLETSNNQVSVLV